MTIPIYILNIEIIAIYFSSSFNKISLLIYLVLKVFKLVQIINLSHKNLFNDIIISNKTQSFSDKTNN